MSAYIYIINDKNYIRITNTQTNVVSYMNKTNLVIQKDNAQTFFLKNDSYVKYYKYADIALPLSQNIDDLLDSIISLTTSEDSNQLIKLDEVEKSEAVLELNTYTGKNDYYIDEISLQTASNVPGTTTYETTKNYVTMDMVKIVAGETNRIVRQSKEYINIPSGKMTVALVSGVLLEDTSATTLPYNDAVLDAKISRIGLFDDFNDFKDELTTTPIDFANGIFIEYDSSGGSSPLVFGATAQQSDCISIVVRRQSDGSYNNETRVRQLNWNGHMANGVGNFGLDFNPSIMNTFVFRYGTLPKTILQVGLLHNGYAVLLHEFLDTDGFNSFTKLPVRWEISETNIAGVDPSTFRMIQSNAVVHSSENRSLKKQLYNAICPTVDIITPLAYDVNFKEITYEGPTDIIFDIKLNNAFIRSKIKIMKIQIMNTQADGSIAMWRLVKNGLIQKYNSAESFAFNPTTYPLIDPIVVHNYDHDNGNYTQYSRADVLSLHSGQVQEQNSGDPYIKLVDYRKVNGGTNIASGYLKGTSMTEINFEDDPNVILSDISGLSDHFSLVVDYMNTPAQIQATVTWVEYD